VIGNESHIVQLKGVTGAAQKAFPMLRLIQYAQLSDLRN
jgi:hypothetical protein